MVAKAYISLAEKCLPQNIESRFNDILQSNLITSSHVEVRLATGKVLGANLCVQSADKRVDKLKGLLNICKTVDTATEDEAYRKQSALFSINSFLSLEILL